MCYYDTQAPSMKLGMQSKLEFLETGDSRVEEEDRYVQMASNLHVPCFIMCSSGTPFWKAQEAPENRGMLTFLKDLSE